MARIELDPQQAAGTRPIEGLALPSSWTEQRSVSWYPFLGFGVVPVYTMHMWIYRRSGIGEGNERVILDVVCCTQCVYATPSAAHRW